MGSKLFITFCQSFRKGRDVLALRATSVLFGVSVAHGNQLEDVPKGFLSKITVQTIHIDVFLQTEHFGNKLEQINKELGLVDVNELVVRDVETHQPGGRDARDAFLVVVGENVQRARNVVINDEPRMDVRVSHERRGFARVHAAKCQMKHGLYLKETEEGFFNFIQN